MAEGYFFSICLIAFNQCIIARRTAMDYSLRPPLTRRFEKGKKILHPGSICANPAKRVAKEEEKNEPQSKN